MLIALENVTFGYKDEILLNEVSLAVSEGERVGLIGGNGEGKTTLLRLIAGMLSPNSGKVFIKNNARIGYLEQSGGFDSDNTVFEEMRSVFTKEQEALDNLRKLENRISVLDEDADEYRVLSAKYENLNKYLAASDGYNYEIKIKTVLNGMGFEKVYDRVIHTMSGGEKTKLKFCKLLLEQPDILILDEPTNHLDVKTLFWLEEYLSSYKGAILVVSHDRYFLDKTVNKIFELENRRLGEFKGNYSRYKVLKAERLETQRREYEKQQEKIAHMQDYVDRNLVRASTTKMAQSRRTALEKMDRIEKPFTPPSPPKFRFTYDEKPYENVLTVNSLTLCAGEKTLFTDGSFQIKRGEKCALIGDNGTGKSTLIKKIVYNANGREIVLGRFAKIAYYDQENDNLNPTNSVLSELWARHSLSSQTEIRAALARVALTAEDIEKPVSALSGGERARLGLAVFESERGNFLVLDEPTNHLDLAARESLEEALKAFDGTILFVSHDRYFIRALADKIVNISAGKLSSFQGDYEEFLAFEKKSEAQKQAPMPEVNVKKDDSFRSKKERAEEAKKRQRAREIEKEIAELEEEETTLNAALTDPAVVADFRLLKEKCDRLEELKRRADSLYEEYETLI